MRNYNFLYTALFLFAILIISSFKLLLPEPENVPVPLPVGEDYLKEWKTIDSLISIGLTKSALELTQKIYDDSRQKGNHPQYIKSLLYKIKLTADYQEEFLKTTIEDIRLEISNAKTPVKQILHSIQADIYWRYYQSNRPKILDRTMVSGSASDDVATWDLNRIMEAIMNHFQASLYDAKVLQQIDLKDYEAILESAARSKEVRPTLYDFLAHRAVDFFMNDEAGLTKPAFTFEIDQKDYFATPQIFSDLKLETSDSLSQKFNALKIFQDLIGFHLNDKEPDALVDVNLQRLEFVKNNAIFNEKDKLYLQALSDFEQKYLSSPASTNISYAIAKHLNQLGQQYNPHVSDDHRWDIQAAVNKCEEAIKRFPESDGALNCNALLVQLRLITLNIKTENVVVPDQPILALLEYKNLKEVFFRVVKMDYESNQQLEKDYRNKNELISQYVKAPVFREWSLNLPDENDFQPHATEIRIDPLSAGFYIILASESNEFIVDSSAIFYTHLWSSTISYISEQTDENSYRFYTLNRETGLPLADVKADLYYQTYDYRTREYSKEAGGRFQSNDNGYFEIPALENLGRSNSFYLEMKWDQEKLITSDRFYHSAYSEPVERKTLRTWFFTDRAIYRPGQTIFFKGIILEKWGDQYDVKPGTSTTIEFLDANYQKIAEVKLTANEYGSFHGSFMAPTGSLNGRMTIRNESGSQQIRVEEYKRPTFEVTFDPVEGSYKIDEMVSLKGNARAFAGNVLPRSKVKFRVVREVRFPWRDYFWNYWPVKQSSMEITNGITETDDNGSFTIDFKAIPDYQTPAKYKPLFSYTIYADVTDITGETQSAQTNVNVGYTALQVNFEIGNAVDRSELSEIKFQTTNLNGQPVSAEGNLRLSLLEEPDRLIREKYWQAPDLHTITKDEYLSSFPYDAYQEEGQDDHLPISSEVLKVTFNSANDSLLRIANPDKLKPGRYALKMETKDEFGEKVEHTQYFTLYDSDSPQSPVHEINWFQVLKAKCEPGDQARFIIGTADRDVNILYEVVQKGNIILSEWLQLSNEQRKINFTVTEELRGGFSVNLYFVKHNRSYQNSFRVDVPYTNKELDFEWMTFRDNISPGEEETWQLKIKGIHGDQVAAELLASMYDASLDAFLDHSWNFQLYPQLSGNIYWNMKASFSSQGGSFNRPYHPNLTRYFFRTYDRLNWFGFDYYGGFPKYKRGIAFDGLIAKQEALPGTTDGIEETMAINEEDMSKSEGSETEPVNSKKSDRGLELRRDFRETAFFYPILKTDENGDVVISFKIPESLTRWKLMGFAHTKDLKYGQFNKEIVTRKDLMIVPNAPRFFRQGDQMSFTAKVVNLSDGNLGGEAVLKFFDPLTMNDITGDVLVSTRKQEFTVVKKGSEALTWQIAIPDKYSIISYQVVAKAGNFSDGEEKPIPVLSNRMLVTESLPLPLKGNETRDFVFEKLNKSISNGSLKNHRLTLEFSSNPAWYAVQALPYMMEQDRESADAAFNRFYANSIASHLANSNPKIRNVFEAWQNYTPDALLSNLEKKEELKSLILTETPWVLDSRDENEQKQRIALLFDINKMAQEKNTALLRLQQLQSSGGGWPWFKGMPDNRYISQQIVLGFARLKELGVYDVSKDPLAQQMLIRAVRYIDQEMKEDYDWIKDQDKDYKTNDHLNQIRIHYLLARSYFMDDVVISKNQEEAFAFFRDQALNYWAKREIYSKGMIAMALNNLGVKSAPGQIMASIQEHALYSEEMGMYFRDNTYGYHWYEAPIETQALLIEAFDNIFTDQKAVEQMKVWLLKQKQTQAWKTSKATADAIYALLLRGSDWLSSDQLANIKVGDQTIDPMQQEDTKVEAGTGYFKTSWSGGEIKPEMGIISVTNENPTIAWGAVYWQYFEDMDKITPHETPLSLKKQLFVERNTASGPVIEPYAEGTDLNVGDKIKVRVELRVDRDMDFVHMKDMRASAFEPVNVLSGYRYQGGLGYYESTLDASTNFFFDYLRKGTYVFEYPLVASQKGDFSNGITTIQCMYAPEFTSHSEGVRVIVK
ncbi:MAG: hypothetical protein KQI35_04390 [Bacteroidetes bacterium]|nr:hypothetical protein [Bacteroidota bacterium]